MFLLLARVGDRVAITKLSDDCTQLGEATFVPRRELPTAVALRERERPRWVWDDTERWYPQLLDAGVRVERCVDLRLSHSILRQSELSAGSELAVQEFSPWDDLAAPAADDGLFALTTADQPDPLTEFRLQRAATTDARLTLLLAAESAGALAAAEMRHRGLPWREEVHKRLLAEALGPRPAAGDRPERLAALAETIRTELDAPTLNPDSPVELLRALRRAGLDVQSTAKWELHDKNHPAIAPLLEYKALARLLSANGWHWLDENVRDGRFRADYVVGGVVTGRWASRGGGGAMQLPKAVRSAVVADPGWKLVVADASQLEPRILAAMSGDEAMAEAGRARDMYSAIVARGAVRSRDQAKVAMLGAMYGATTGDSGRLMPALTRAFPRAIRLVESAARTGESGGIVSTWLGRSSPRPDAQWFETQSRASAEGATDAHITRARRSAKAWGRFTRNFIVQGTAAEWAMSWIALTRQSLFELGGWRDDSPHLAFFLHDELVIHTPAGHAEDAARIVTESAARAGELVFRSSSVEFPLSVAVVDSYAGAK